MTTNRRTFLTFEKSKLTAQSGVRLLESETPECAQAVFLDATPRCLAEIAYDLKPHGGLCSRRVKASVRV